jgi:hypothetical protein
MEDPRFMEYLEVTPDSLRVHAAQLAYLAPRHSACDSVVLRDEEHDGHQDSKVGAGEGCPQRTGHGVALELAGTEGFTLAGAGPGFGGLHNQVIGELAPAHSPPAYT